jgi:acyl carrier protein
MSTHDQVTQILNDSLQLGERSRAFTAATPLLGSLPEFDSMAVVSVITALEQHFGFTVSDDELTAETFETVGSLSAFVDRKLGS